MKEREIQFTNYFCLSVYTLRITKYCLEMARAYCASPKLRNVLRIAEMGTDARLTDITLKLKDESRRDIMQDLASDDLQALGNILHNLVLLPSISDAEDAINLFIKNIKNIQHEKMECATPEPVEAGREDSGLHDNGKTEEAFSWPVIERKREQGNGLDKMEPVVLG